MHLRLCYGFITHDQCQLLFEPRIINHDKRRFGFSPIQHPDVVDDVYDTRENMDGYNPELVVRVMLASAVHS